MASSNTIVANAVAAKNAVAKNALDVNQQREIQSAYAKVDADVDTMLKEAQPLIQRCNAISKMHDDLYAKLEKLKDDNNKFFRKWEDTAEKYPVFYWDDRTMASKLQRLVSASLYFHKNVKTSPAVPSLW